MTQYSSQPSVLIVDSDPDLRFALMTRLEYEGYEIETAVDGTTCLRRLRQRTFDAVLLNIMLPDRPCGFTLNELGAIHPTLPVILMTTMGPVTWDEGDHAPSAILTIPFQPKELTNLLRKVIGLDGKQP
jgi:DNA-binding NtrC family response regulator